MDAIQDILLIAVLVAGIALIGVLISVLLSMRRTLLKIGDDIRSLSDELVPVINKVQEVAIQTSEVLAIIEENRERITAATEYVRKMTANVYRLQNILQVQIEPGLTGLARRIAGVRSGIEAFVERWQRGR
jgi:hypothetical protein